MPSSASPKDRGQQRSRRRRRYGDFDATEGIGPLAELEFHIGVLELRLQRASGNPPAGLPAISLTEAEIKVLKRELAGLREQKQRLLRERGERARQLPTWEDIKRQSAAQRRRHLYPMEGRRRPRISLRKIDTHDGRHRRASRPASGRTRGSRRTTGTSASRGDPPEGEGNADSDLSPLLTGVGR
jgi:hypothetical protein